MENRGFDMYTKHEIVERLHNGVHTVVFTKVNGDERTMRATLLPEYVNNGKMLLQESESKRPENPNVVSVWDMDNNGWRSFRVDSVKELA